jgi:cobalt-zinc-cadmium efflux system membrane fusion protein
MEIASPTEQDFEVTIKAAGKIDVPPEKSKSNYFRWW